MRERERDQVTENSSDSECNTRISLPLSLSQSSMNRFESLPSLTLNTLSAQLYPDETLILHQDGVGLYDGLALPLSLSLSPEFLLIYQATFSHD